ncbi:MAG: copper transporter [Bacillota bacterium]
MIIDLRYHIASLVAVFLALGLGILIGTNLLGNDVMVNTLKSASDKMEKNLDSLRLENKKAQEEIADYKTIVGMQKQFEKQTIPMLVYGKLSGKQVAVIETNNYGLHDDWLNTLTGAGARISSITTILEGFDISDETKRKQIATKLMSQSTEEKDVYAAVVREIAGGILTGQNLENLEYFSSQGLLKTSGSYGVPVQAVIFVGGSRDKTTARVAELDVPMMKLFLAKNLPVYGVENSDVEFSYMKDYQKLKVSTVDNVDLYPGQFSLVMAMAGKPGNYGIKPTAKMLMPSIP